jgi:hypothetical protein
METMNNASMISDFFEVVDQFVKKRKAQCAGCEQKECCHYLDVFIF